MRLVKSLLIAISMYSKIPVPTVDWDEESMKYTMCFFPLVGAAAGGLILLWQYICRRTGVGNILETAGYLLIPVIVTGGIHLDGLLDTSDALSSWLPVEKKLEILKDPNAGAFAVIVCAGYFLAAFGIWSELGNRSLTVLAIGFILSRSLSGLSIVLFKKAKNTGLAAAFSDSAARRTVMITMAGYIIVCAGAMILLDWKAGLACCGGAAVSFGYYRWTAYQKFGGITGDLAGFFLQICELLMAAAVLIISF